MKRMINNKTLSIITILLMLLINVFSPVGVVLNTGTVYASSYTFDSSSAINYAETWWNSRNTQTYHDYGSVDCANFVSQILIAGGLNLRESPYVDSWGCVPSCDNLNIYLVNYLGVRYETRSRNEPTPSWFLPGDVAIFGDSQDHWQHSIFAVDTDNETGATVCDAHSNNRQHVTVQFYWDADPTFSLCTYYNVTEAVGLADTSVYLNDAVAIKGKPVAASAAMSTGGNTPLAGVNVKFLIQQRVKNVNTWVSVGSAVSSPGGIATISIPAKSITMDPQPIKAIFVGDDTYGGSTDIATIRRR